MASLRDDVAEVLSGPIGWVAVAAVLFIVYELANQNPDPDSNSSNYENSSGTGTTLGVVGSLGSIVNTLLGGAPAAVGNFLGGTAYATWNGDTNENPPAVD